MKIKELVESPSKALKQELEAIPGQPGDLGYKNTKLEQEGFDTFDTTDPKTEPITRITDVLGDPQLAIDLAAVNAPTLPLPRLRYELKAVKPTNASAVDTQPIHVLVPKVESTSTEPVVHTAHEMYDVGSSAVASTLSGAELFAAQPDAGDALSMISEETPDKWLDSNPR